MRKYSVSWLMVILLWMPLAGCEKHPLEKEVSLEDAARMLIDESSEGISIYGGNLVAADTITTELSGPPAMTMRWLAEWDFLGHTSTVIFDTVVDRGVTFRGAEMSVLDSMAVRLTLLPPTDTIMHKANFATARTSALLVQLGVYGDLYHGWVLRRMAYRRFRGPSMISPLLSHITAQCGSNSWSLAEAEFSIDDVPRFSPGDSITMRAQAAATDLLFLNVADAGAIRRIPMVYDAQRHEFMAGWRVSSSAVSRNYYQAVIEAYGVSSLTNPDPRIVGVSGQTFVYRIR